MNRVVKIIIILICILIIIGGAWWYINKKNKKIEISENEPEEEISQAQERETLISLYFKSKKTGEIEPEARLMDVKELVKKYGISEKEITLSHRKTFLCCIMVPKR